MVYMGSKNRLAKELIPIITANLKENQYYVEPFVGGCNLMDKVKHPLRLGADNNKYLIELLKYVQNGGELPEFIDKDEYLKVKADKESYPEWYAGYVGFICSFRGLFFKSYAGNGVKKLEGKDRNYQTEQRNNLLKQVPNIQGVKFECSEYDKLIIPDNSVIYCDPPYQDVSGYSSKFDSAKFWEWVREMDSKGHTLFISEYQAPEDFKCIWTKEVSSNLGSTGKKASEKLFIYDRG